MTDLSTRLIHYLDSHGATVRRRDLRVGCQESFRPYFRAYWLQMNNHLQDRDDAPRRWVMGLRWTVGGLRPERESWAVGTPSAIVKAFLTALANHRHNQCPNLRLLIISPSATSSWSGPATLYSDAWDFFPDQGVTTDFQESFLSTPCHTVPAG